MSVRKLKKWNLKLTIFWIITAKGKIKMWLVIIVGLGILLLPLIIDTFEWIMIIGFTLLILSWFFHALVWLIPVAIIAFGGQWLINKHYLKTGKLAWLASKKVKDK